MWSRLQPHVTEAATVEDEDSRGPRLALTDWVLHLLTRPCYTYRLGRTNVHLLTKRSTESYRARPRPASPRSSAL
eukprot:scaffold22219_cov73-Phaeocystis_antarctica.AAC.3